MDKDLIYRLLIYISAFGITDNLMEYFKVSVTHKIILYSLLLIVTCKFLGPSTK